MADTERTLAAMLVLGADNTTGDISPQDYRDGLVSVSPSFGSMYFSTPAATTPAGAGTYLKALGTTTSVNLGGFTMPASNKLLYTGTPDIHVHCACSISMTCASTNKILGFKIAKNGSVFDHSEVHRKVATGSDIGSTALHSDFAMSTNDYVELFLANITDTNTVTIEFGYVFCLGMFV